jgi:putative hydrolase of the HAD superfamily
VVDLFREINTEVWKEYELGRATSAVIRTRRFVNLLEALGLNGDSQAVSDSYVDHLSQTDFLFDGAMELLETLSRHAPLVLLTNGISRVQRSRFARTRVPDYFTDIVISEEVGVQKPDPRIFRIALDRAAVENVTPGEAVMIGDNLHSDIQGALEAGLDACWVNLRDRLNDTDVQPTYAVTRLDQVPGVLGLT